jgi:mono/diheme cytochrome c family protein
MNRKLIVAALPLALSLGACDWFTDFKSQPRIEPWEPTSQADNDTLHPPRGNPQGSVPITGTFAAGYQVSHRNFPATIDSLAGVANPTPVSPASLTNGRKYYTINCAVCHGETGAGNGPAVKYGMVSPTLIGPPATTRSDGYIFGMIRNGRGLMPTYDRIEEMDRWDVVNYVRALQGSTPNSTGDTKPYGYPGQTGTTLPGVTQSAPTRSAPMWHPTTGATPTPAAPTDSAAGPTARPGADSTAPPPQTKRGPP